MDSADPAPGAVVIRVLLADDQALIRRALRALVEEAPDIDVVAEAADGREAVSLAARLTPDVVLMDVRMPELDGLAATERILAESVGTRVIVLTTYHLDEYVFRAVRAGASGFLLKDGDADELVRAIRAVAAGDALMSPAALGTLLRDYAGSAAPDGASAALLAGLTERERQVLSRMADGETNADIAAAMHLGVSTVKTHVSSILAKLGVADRTQAVVVAFRGGLQG